MAESLDLIDGKVLLKIEEAARYLSIGRSHLYKQVMTGAIGSVLIGRSRRIPVFAIRQYVDRLEVQKGARPSVL
jgi:excisionase family DNA binding protein